MLGNCGPLPCVVLWHYGTLRLGTFSDALLLNFITKHADKSSRPCESVQVRSHFHHLLEEQCLHYKDMGFYVGEPDFERQPRFDKWTAKLYFPAYHASQPCYTHFQKLSHLPKCATPAPNVPCSWRKPTWKGFSLSKLKVTATCRYLGGEALVT